jgi:2-dehydropantoate 2-reductase
MKILVVGAGAVGQVFGRHLQLGGHEVTFYVRANRVDHLSDGLLLYPLNRRQARKQPILFKSFEIMTDPGQIAAKHWDQIYLCLPSNALRGGLLEALGPHIRQATVVTVQPGLTDGQLVAQHFAESRIVSGMITFTSYKAPLPGEAVPRPGTAYWFAPLVPCPFSGDSERVKGVVAALRSGRIPARVHPNVPRLLAFFAAAQTPLSAGLQCAGWSFKGFRRSLFRPLAERAAGEAIKVVSEYSQHKPPLTLRSMRGLTFRLALTLSPYLYPFDLEQFFAAHYAKLGEQTPLLLAAYIEQGQEQGLPVAALEELGQALRKFLA